MARLSGVHTFPRIQKSQERIRIESIPVIFLHRIQKLLRNAVLAIELVNPASRLCLLLLTRIEWMALRTNLDVDVLLRRTSHKGIATVTGHSSLIVIRMDPLSHLFHLPYHNLLQSVSERLQLSVLYHRDATDASGFLGWERVDENQIFPALCQNAPTAASTCGSVTTAISCHSRGKVPA